MLTDKQIEREEAFCEDWYMNRKMEKTPTYADAIAWADKTMIEKACDWMMNFKNAAGEFPLYDYVGNFRKAMEE